MLNRERVGRMSALLAAVGHTAPEVGSGPHCPCLLQHESARMIAIDPVSEPRRVRRGVRRTWSIFSVSPRTLLRWPSFWSRVAGRIRTPVEGGRHVTITCANSCFASRARTRPGVIGGSLASCAGSCGVRKSVWLLEDPVGAENSVLSLPGVRHVYLLVFHARARTRLRPI
jgi:hypothetical protein